MWIGPKSAYAEPQPDDGLWFLTDRLWPRGLSRDRLRLDGWLKELAPSDELRRWFGHDLEKWEEFRSRYFAELAGREEAVATLLGKIEENKVTLVFAARDRKHNNATVLREYLQQLMTDKGENSK